MYLGSTTTFTARANTARKIIARAAAIALLAAPISAMASVPAPGPTPTVSNEFFDYFITNNAPSGFVAAPFLSDSNAMAISNILAGLPTGAVRAVKVVAPISNSTANLIFNNSNYKVSYVFGDLEGPNAATDAAKLQTQVRYLNGVVSKGSENRSSSAYVGNFGFTSLPTDPTQPKGYDAQRGKPSFAGFGKNDYMKAGLTMENAELYPGSPSFRNPVASNSSAPNVRSALFTLPVLRASYVTQQKDPSHANIPWVANFNNWGNGAFHTANAPQNTQGYQYFWDNPTGDQMLSRRDFANMVAHYRLRGVDSLSLLNSGNTAVTDQQMRDDARAGWSEPSINAIMNALDHETLLESKKVTYPYGQFDGLSKIISDGKIDDAEHAGSILSGAYSLDIGKLDLLISNMDGDAHTITAPSQIGGYSLAVRDFVIAPGSHILVEYSLTGAGNKKGWSVAGQHVPFTAIANSRGGFGIPEPGTLSLLVVGAVLGINRRRRAEKAKA